MSRLVIDDLNVYFTTKNIEGVKKRVEYLKDKLTNSNENDLKKLENDLKKFEELVPIYKTDILRKDKQIYLKTLNEKKKLFERYFYGKISQKKRNIFKEKLQIINYEINSVLSNN